MLSPSLAASIGGVKTPRDLLKLPIVDPGDYWWNLWFTAVGIPEPDLLGNPQSRFGDQHLEGKAVLAGMGVGILTPVFYQTELAQGQLIQPFDIVGFDDHFYWLVYPEARRNVPKIRVFRDWLLGQLDDASNEKRAGPRVPPALSILKYCQITQQRDNADHHDDDLDDLLGAAIQWQHLNEIEHEEYHQDGDQ